MTTITWQFVSHINLVREHILAHRLVEHPQIHREIVTQYRDGLPMESKAFYFIDDDEREFTDLAACIAAVTTGG